MAHSISYSLTLRKPPGIVSYTSAWPVQRRFLNRKPPILFASDVSQVDSIPAHHARAESMGGTWDACIRLPICVPDSKDPIAVARQALATTPIEIDTEKRIISNRGGIALMHNIMHLQIGIAILRRNEQRMWRNQLRMKKDIAQLKQHKRKCEAFMSLMRSSALDDWADQKRKYSQYRRNVAAHGGNVAADVGTAEYYVLTEKKRVEGWKTVFPKYYGVPFEYLQPRISRMSTKLISVLDRRATVYSMHVWGNSVNEARKTKIIICADQIIARWREGKANFANKDSEVSKLLEEINADYAAGIVHKAPSAEGAAPKAPSEGE